jgi:hypothetical protein
MTPQEQARVSRLATDENDPFGYADTVDQAIEHCSYSLFAAYLCENAVCFAEYRNIADRYIAYEYFMTRPQLLARFKMALIERVIHIDRRPPTQRLFNEMFMGAFGEIYTDVVAQRTKYLDPYYGVARPLDAPQVAKGLLGSSQADDESLAVASILNETAGFNPFDPFNRGGDASVWDGLTHRTTALFAWLISQNVECTLEDRRESDWLVAEKRISDIQFMWLWVLNRVYTPLPTPISQEYFNERCMEIFVREYNAMIADRAKYLGTEYGEATLIPVPDLHPLA